MKMGLGNMRGMMGGGKMMMDSEEDKKARRSMPTQMMAGTSRGYL